MDPISGDTYSLSAQRENEGAPAAAASRTVGSLSHLEERNVKNLLPQIVATGVAASGHLVVGMCLAYSAVLIPQLEGTGSDLSVTKAETSWIASVVALVTPVGCFVGAWVMDRWGRLTTLKVSVVPTITGWILIAVARNVPTLLLGRIIASFAIPLATNPGMVYVTEIARKDMRGSFLTVGPSYVSLGMMISYLSGWLMNWRTIAWTVLLYTIVPFLFLFILPDSPAWLVSKRRIEEARDSLNWFHKHQPKLSEEQTFAELQLQLLIQEDERKKLEAQTKGGGKIRAFMKPTGYKPLLIISGIFLGQQFSGIYIFLFYSVNFFQEIGTSVNPYAASVLVGLIRLIMSILNIWLLKLFGRRTLIVTSASGMAVSLFVSGLFTSRIKSGTTELTWLPAICLLLYMVFSMVGLLIIPWTLTAEFFPIKIRSVAHSICVAVANCVMFLAVKYYLNMADWFGGPAGVQWFFAAVSATTAIYIFVFMPETRQMNLMEIENYFQNNTVYLWRKKKARTAINREENNGTNYNEVRELINHT